MDGIIWVVVANAVVWAGIGAYLTFIAARQHALATRLTQWEKLHD